MRKANILGESLFIVIVVVGLITSIELWVFTGILPVAPMAIGSFLLIVWLANVLLNGEA